MDKAEDAPPAFSSAESRLEDAVVGRRINNATLWAEMKAIMLLAAPICATFVCGFMQQIVLMLIVGHTGAENLAAVAVAQMFSNASGMSLLIGCASAVDTLASQAVGANNYKRVGAVSLRAMAILFLASVLVAIFWWNSEVVLANVGQDPPTVVLATQFIRVLIPALPGCVVFEVLKRHLQCLGVATPPFVAVIVGIATSGVTGYVLVYHSELAFLGAPVATVIFHWTQAGCLLLYMRFHRALNGAARSIAALGGCASKARRRKDAAAAANAGTEADPGAAALDLVGGAAVLNRSGPSAVDGVVSPLPLPGVAVAAVGAASSDTAAAIDSLSVPSARTAPAQQQQQLNATAPPPPFHSSPSPPLYHAQGQGGEEQWEEGDRVALNFGALVGEFAATIEASAAAAEASAVRVSGAGDSAAPAASANPPPPVDADDVDALVDASWSDWSLAEAFSGWLEFIGLGIPSAAMLFVEWGSFEAAALICGLVSIPTLAAHTIIATTAALSFMPILGISVASSIRVGQLMGDRRPGDAQVCFKGVTCLASSYALLNACFIGSVHAVWGSMFTDDADVRELLSRWLALLAAYSAFDAIQCSFQGVLRGVGRPSIAAVANVCAYVVVGLPLCYVFGIVLGAGLPGVWAGFIIAVAVASVALAAPLLMLDWKKHSDIAFKRSVEGGTSPAAH